MQHLPIGRMQYEERQWFQDARFIGWLKQSEIVLNLPVDELDAALEWVYEVWSGSRAVERRDSIAFLQKHDTTLAESVADGQHEGSFRLESLDS